MVKVALEPEVLGHGVLIHVSFFLLVKPHHEAAGDGRRLGLQ